MAKNKKAIGLGWSVIMTILAWLSQTFAPQSRLLFVSLLVGLSISATFTIWQYRWIQSSDNTGKKIMRTALSAGPILGLPLFLGLIWWPHSVVPAPERPRFSSTQVIQFSGDTGNDILNLDNIALMVQVWDANLEKVGLALTKEPPTYVEKPKAGVKYPTGGGFTVEYPNAGKGMEFKASRSVYSGPGDYYAFTLVDPSHLVKVDGRKFRVTLLKVHDKSTENKTIIEYTFGIREE